MALAVVNAIPDYPSGPAGRQAQSRGARGSPARRVALSRARRRGTRGRADRRRCARLSSRLPCCAAARCRCSSPAHAMPSRTFETPRQFVPAIRSIVRCYLVAWPCSSPASCCAALVAGRMTHRIDALRAPLLVSWQLTRDCDLCCLHCCTESAPGKRMPDELDADEAMQLVARHHCATRCPTSCCAAASRWSCRISSRSPRRWATPACSSRSKPTASASTPRWPQRLARLPIRSIQISLDGDTEETYQRPAAGRLARQGARGVPGGARRRAAARDHLRADAPQHPRARRRHRACPRLGRVSLQHRQADAHRHGGAPVGTSSSRRPPRTANSAARSTSSRQRLDMRWNSAIFLST